jgi:hypothetical protein
LTGSSAGDLDDVSCKKNKKRDLPTTEGLKKKRVLGVEVLQPPIFVGILDWPVAFTIIQENLNHMLVRGEERGTVQKRNQRLQNNAGFWFHTSPPFQVNSECGLRFGM